MKHILSLLLVTVLMLSGCALSSQATEPVTFYYLRQHTQEEEYHLFFSEGAIGAEEREVTGYRNDLDYLLALYMRGPVDSSLRFPFPVGSKIIGTHLEDRKLTVAMNAISSRFNEMDVTVSCACIAKTCMELADVTEVIVESQTPDGQVLFSRSFTNDNLILTETSTLPSESETTQ